VEGLDSFLCENTLDPVLPAYGDKHEQANDLRVLLTGGDFSFSRSYTSDLAYSDALLIGAGWRSDHFAFIQQDGDDLEIINSGFETAFFEDQSGTGAGPWQGLDPWDESITAATLTIDSTTYAVWTIDRPGVRSRSYYRPHAGGGGVTATPATLEGLPIYEEDLYGNHRLYLYTVYGTALGDPAKEHARLTSIECYRNASTPVREATIEFTWQDNDALANKGTLTRISVMRPTGGADLETQRVEYTYKASGDGRSNALGAEGDLIQVWRYVRLDNSTGSLATWRPTVTQYRYHGGETNESSVDLDGDGFIESGSAHQLKAVINPEQIEYFAQQLVDNDGSFSTFSGAVLELLDRDDNEAWYSGASEITTDVFAKLVAEYEGTGEKRVLSQWLLSSCGCSGGSTQGTLYQYSHFSYASGDFTNTMKIVDSYDNGMGSMVPHRTRYYDVVDGDAGAAFRPVTESVAVIDGSKEWVAVYLHDDKRRLTRRNDPSAVSAYTPGTSSTPPSYTLSTNSGLVTAFAYEGDTEHETELRVREGQSATIGDFYLVREIERSATRPWLPTEMSWNSNETLSTPSADDLRVIEFDYGFYSGTDAPAWVKNTREDALVAENGPGGNLEDYWLHDEAGRKVWVRYADGVLVENEFDDTTGVITKTTHNATNAIGGTWVGLSTSGWGLSGDKRVVETEVDELGRVLTVTSDATATGFERTTRTVREMRSLPERPGIDYYAVITFPDVVETGVDEKYAGPATVMWSNADGHPLRRSGYIPDADGNGDYDLATPSNSLGSELTRSVTDHAVSGLVEKRRTYHDISNGWFVADADKHAETSYEYDELGRVHTVTDPDGTITRYTYDVLDRRIKTEVGTVATGGGADMVTVSEAFYDSGGAATQGVGDGRVTLSRVHVDGSTTRDTEHVYDYRGRRLKTLNPTTPHILTEYDNLGRATRRAVVTSSSPTTIDAEAANRVSLTETFYSQRGTPYKTRTAIDPTQTGGSLAWQEGHTWVDEVGRTVASWSGGAATKTEHDALGRVTKTYTTDRRGDAAPGAAGNYADAASVAGDVVLTETEHSYITDTGLVDMTTTRQRAHDAVVGDTGALSGLISEKKITTYSASYYDAAGRPVHSVAYGTNQAGFKHGGTAPTVTQSSPPTRSASGLLMSSTEYDDYGRPHLRTGPDGTETKTFYDDMGRTIGVVENYVDASINGWDGTREHWDVIGVGGGGGDVDRMTTFVYSDGGKR